MTFLFPSDRFNSRKFMKFICNTNVLRTSYSGLHFTMRTKLKDEWYTYDGIERPKVKRVDSSPNMPSLGQINCIVYVLSYGTTPYEQFSI